MTRSSRFVHAYSHAPRRLIGGLGREAHVIRLHARRGESLVVAAGYALLAVAAWILIAAMLGALARSGQDLLGHLAPGWPSG